MELALAAFICALLALFSRKYLIPSIPLYVIAGLILGKSGFGLFEVDEITEFLTKVGILFLLFYIGLHINFERLSKNVFVSGIFDLITNFSLSFLASLLLGFSYYEAFVIASAIYISSSAIVLHSLVEFRKLIFKEAETVVWLMVFEDVILVFILIFSSAKIDEIPLFFLKILSFTLAIYLLHKVSHNFKPIFSRDDEVPLLISFSIATAAITFSEILEIPEGFVAIMFGASLSKIREIEKFVTPFKDVFIVLFFFFFGASVEVKAINAGAVIVFILIAILGKVISGILIGLSAHKSVKSGLEIGFDTIARGEFSIFLAYAYGTDETMSIVALVVLVTSIVGAFMAKHSYDVISKLERSVKLITSQR
ncbi:sodium/hydrogen exchanger [Ferroglobus placidus DSM 10642]|uniref:Sodium/hydrogen exchanger n=1 Tax=Ferroglobus placidus (strain DSM 10642 / AEDII12DO) TaxID=589924 RepID=D3RWL2_FERPA|nr:cation:proton antiporter [Ferroglobus placidus]ADC64875.1 sodium/hydrogen exchanger [Ferroglobus placidus DSM 10642]